MKKSYFINRQEEMGFLGEIYRKSQKEAQLIVIYGRRRTGKTELIKHFFQDKPHLYFLASRAAAADQLRSFSQQAAEYFGDDFLGETGFRDWRGFFDYLSAKIGQQRIIIVVDEFPYLVEQDKAIPSHFQYGWDEKLKNTRATLVLMGSSVSMMYQYALNSNAPLYGRRSGQWLLEPFNFTHSRNFYSHISFETAFSFFAIAGGIPLYLKEFDGKKNLWFNIRNSLLTKGRLLYTEPELLLAEEVKNPGIYLTIMKAIGLGDTKYSDLLNHTLLPHNVLSKYLSVLQKLRLVTREVPVTEKSLVKSKKGIYRLNDNFLQFYFRFVYPNLGLIEGGSQDVLLRKVKKDFPCFVANIYERTAPEFLQNAIKQKALPPFLFLGRYWDKDIEIDTIGLDPENNRILFTEVKWNTQPLGMKILRDLQAKAKRVSWGKAKRQEYFALIAKGGFQKDLVELAREEKVILIEKDSVLDH